ncbi:hypothetical protein FHR20_004532 [Sphingomonas leidyi]|uniref:Uncharacterized protein n=1 Tax=Sphingomonas leidyi TaxID=68569 RepID=A0A7X5V5B0_9SPHN|nr:hypothetical protein [Sphingomonas leidyi]
MSHSTNAVIPAFAGMTNMNVGATPLEEDRANYFPCPGA